LRTVLASRKRQVEITGESVFDFFPVEICLHIFSFLTKPKDLLKASEVCLHWNYLANEDSLYRTMLEIDYTLYPKQENSSYKETYIAASRKDKQEWYFEGLYECSKCIKFFWGAKKHSMICKSKYTQHRRILPSKIVTNLINKKVVIVSDVILTF